VAERIALSKENTVMIKKHNLKSVIRNTTLGLGALVLINCGGYSTIIKMQEVNEIPVGKYERIIKLYNPEGISDKTLVGLVFIKKGAKVCTDYPREETIKSLDELTMMERHSYQYFSNYAVKVGVKTFGFVSLPIDYQTNLWENNKDENCKYKVQIILPYSPNGNYDGEGIKAGSGVGGHGH
jgi:hypothetical protein